MNRLKRITAFFMMLCLLLTALPATGLASPPSEAAATSIVNLTTEYQKDPIGIDAAAPRFGWQMESNLIGQRQEAYEIRLYESTDPAVPVWSKKDSVGTSTGIVYDGEPLADATEYCWQVTVKASDGQQYTSDYGYFETGVSNTEEWQETPFIKAGISSAGQIFRTEFQLQDEVASARLYITALGAYEAYLNGEQVIQVNHDGTETYPHMAPGHGNWDTKWYYQTYDVTRQLAGQSEAALAVLAGTGWYGDKMSATSGDPAVKAMVRIVYKSGEIACVSTNTSDWKVSMDGGIVKQGLYYGEDYDANRENALGDYKNPGYDDSSWIGASGDTSNVIVNDLTGVTARYVRIKVSETSAPPQGEPRALQIMEFDIRDSSNENVALGKTARCDQNWEGIADVWYIANLTDGNPATGFTSVYNYTPPVYVAVDLGREYDLSRLTIYCRDNLGSAEAGICPNYPKQYELEYATSVDFGNDADPGWTKLEDVDAGEIQQSPTLKTVSYSGELAAQQGPIGQIVDEFEESPKSVVVYDGEIGKTADQGGEIVVQSYYAYAAPEDELYNNNVTVKDAGEMLFDGGITLPAGQTMVVDFGQNMTAIPEIVFAADQNTKATMRFAEALNDGSKRATDTYAGDAAQGGDALYAADGPKGSIYTKSLRTGNAKAYYTFAGGGEETYQPRMTFFGYRYFEITADEDITVYSLRSRALSSVSERTGFIETNNQDVNRLFLNSVYGQLSNNFHITTGCPQRDERDSWTGDAQVFTQTGLYHFNSAAFLSYYQDILSDLTRKQGFPGSTTTYGAFRGICTHGWDDIEITQPWYLYLQTGDKAILEKNWDAMVIYMNFLKAQERQPDQAAMGGIVFADWLNFQGTSIEVMSDLYYGFITQLMADMAQILGKENEAVYYADKLQALKEKFIQSHVDFDGQGKMTVRSDRGSLPFGGNSSCGPLEANSQTALLWMLKLDYFTNDDARRQAVDLLVANVKNIDQPAGSVRQQYGANTLSTGFLGTNILAPVLSQVGAGDVSYDVILNDGMPSWLQSVKNGATTMWERWDTYSAEKGFGNQEMNSFNHFANGSVAEWMYTYMAGIVSDPAAPGFKNIILQPTLDTGEQYNNQERIHSVKGSYDSYYGTIISNWESDAGELVKYETTVPANTTADLYLPVTAAAVNSFTNIGGVVFKGMEKHNGIDTAHFQLQAGGYVFTVENGALTAEAADGYIVIEPEEPVDKGALQKLYNTYKNLRQGDYTNESWAVFTAARTDAKNVLDKADATQQEVDEALSALNRAYKALVEKPEQTVRVTGVKLDRSKASLKIGESVTLKATVAPTNAANKAVKWSSGNSSVAAVDASGRVKAIKAGKTTITVTTVDGSKKASCEVTIKQSVTKLAFKTPAYTVTKKGQKVRLKKYLTVTPKNASDKAVTWKSSNKRIAVVDQNGTVKFKAKKGKVTITATAKDGSRKKAKITIIYGKKIAKIKLSQTKLTLKQGKSKTIKAKITKPVKPAYKKVIWSSSNPKVATVSGKGKIKALKKGKATITALAGDGSGKKAKIKVTVR